MSAAKKDHGGGTSSSSSEDENDTGASAMDVSATGNATTSDRRPTGSGCSAPAAKRRMKKDDSGISVDADVDMVDGRRVEGDNEDGEEEDDGEGMTASATKAKLSAACTTSDGRSGETTSAKAKQTRRLRKARAARNAADSTSEDRSSPDSGHNEEDRTPTDFVPTENTSTAAAAAAAAASKRAPGNGGGGGQQRARHSLGGGESSSPERCSLDSSDDSDDDDADASERRHLLLKSKPKHRWSLYSEISGRQYGVRSNYSSDLFRLRAYGSLHMAERLELMYKMKRHEGCVNTLNFNGTGTRLVSGSDDLSVAVWDWAIGETVLTYESGHRSNVFQAKFMPLGNDCHIVSCARDGQVRLAELSSTGVCKGTKRLIGHKGPAHKLALEPDSPHLVLSCGEDGVVFDIDLRESKPHRLLICREGGKKVPLYTINANPNNPFEFAIGGKDHSVRIYDKRKIPDDDGALKKYCPHHLLTTDIRANVTCLVYNYNGSELLASYNDEDIYTFDTSHSDGADFTHRYQGHRNNATVKGVNYFGPKSEFVVSGSDCGHIYLWEHKSESIIQFMPGDEGGVVNCLEPHPHIPVLATSGLDDDIKVWVPSCEKAPKLMGLRSTMRSNRKERDDERRREPETIDGQMLWFLLHHLRSTARRRAREEGQNVDESSTDSVSDEDSDDNEYLPHTVQCAPS